MKNTILYLHPPNNKFGFELGHDNSGPAPGWFLEKVVIDDSLLSRVYTFPCGRWFSKTEDDGRITRELLAGKGDAGIPYTVQIYTGK